MNALNLTLAVITALALSACSGGDSPSETAEKKSPATASDSSTPNTAESADTVYTNGRIYTVNEAQPWAEAVAIKDGKFIAVGSNTDVKAVTGDDTKVVDLAGKFVMPGVTDLHTHPFISPWYGSMNLALQHPDDPEKILEEVKAYAEANPDKEWILGGQWHLGIFPDDSPRKELLDAIVSDRPVNLLDQTGHATWLNSKAMEIAAITRDTPTSNLIVIDKDPETGEPTGTLRELALQLPERVTPQAKPEEYAQPIADIFDMFLSYGITSQQPAEGHRAPLDALVMLEKEGRLHQRVFVSWDWKTTLNLAYTVEDIEAQIADRAKYESDYIYPNYVKIFAEGSPLSRTSLLLEPYEGTPDFYGEANMSLEEFTQTFIRFDSMGVGVHVHSMGDGTTRLVVDALEQMKKTNGDSGVRHKIAHNTMITPEDLRRLSKLKDVNIDFSPPLWNPHPAAISGLLPQVGEDRVLKTYPVKTALETGLHVGQGSDWLTVNPTPNPFPHIEGFVTRMNPDDPGMGVLNSSEAITLEQAIRVCTIEGAWVLGVEDEFGSIQEDKFADFIVLDQNLFDLEKASRLDQIGETQVLITVVDGKVVYDASAQAGNGK